MGVGDGQGGLVCFSPWVAKSQIRLSDWIELWLLKKKKLKKKCQVASVTSDSLQPSKLEPTVFLCPWGFSRLENWIRLTFPSSGDLPYPGIERTSPALAGGFFAISATWEAPLPTPYPRKRENKSFPSKGTKTERWTRNGEVGVAWTWSVWEWGLGMKLELDRSGWYRFRVPSKEHGLMSFRMVFTFDSGFI